MNNTGTYIWDERKRQIVKVSDEIPTLPTKVWFPKSGYKYYDKSLNKTFYSNTEKREWMKNNGLREFPQVESNKQKETRCAEIINTERTKQGLKPKTVSQLKGDS